MTLIFNTQSLRSGSKRYGTTITELVVSIAVVCLLVSLLLNAVHSAREAARRFHCLSNLRNLSISALAFESANGSLPKGIDSPKSMSHNSRGLHNFVGHLVHLLPHINENMQHDFWDGSYRSQSPWWKRDLPTCIKSANVVFRCPSDDASFAIKAGSRDNGTIMWASGQNRTVSYLWLSGIPPSPVSSDVGLTNYLGNAGRWPIDGRDTTFPPNQQLLLDEFRGPFRIGRAIRLREITDGLSNTLLLGEVTGGYDSDRLRITSFGLPCSPMWTHANAENVNSTTYRHHKDWFRFSSSHTGNLLNWTKADGSCLTIAAHMDSRIMLSLSGIADSKITLLD